jgi:putative addiction module antidote
MLRLNKGMGGDNITNVITRKGLEMSALKLTQIGNSVGVILPKEVLARLKVEKGDTLFMSEAANGFTLSTYSPEFEAQMTEARRIMKKRRAVLHELAK